MFSSQLKPTAVVQIKVVVQNSIQSSVYGTQVDAIFRHESQKDRPLFPGADEREFWQRAQDRNKVTLSPRTLLSGFADSKCAVILTILLLHA